MASPNFGARLGRRRGATGRLTEPKQADDIIREGKADIVLLARAFLHNPYWPYRSPKVVGFKR